MKGASESNDFAAAAENKKQFDMYIAQAQLETSLYKKCLWASDYAAATINQLQAKQKYADCIELSKLKDIATEYLATVSDADVAFVRDRDEKEAAAKRASLLSMQQSFCTPCSPADEAAITIDSGDESEAGSDAEAWDPEIDAEIGEDEDFPDDEEELLAMLDDMADPETLLQDLRGVVNTQGFEVAASAPGTAGFLFFDREIDELVRAVKEIKQKLRRRDTKAKAINSRKRKMRVYASTASASVKSGPKPIQKPPSLDSFRKFVAQTQFRVQKAGVSHLVDVTRQMYIMSNGELFCNCCKKHISWNNRGPHMVAEAHGKNRDAAEEVAADVDDARPMMQQRITQESLVGSTYADERINAILKWLKVAARVNISSDSFDSHRAVIQTVSSVPVPGRRELSQAIPDWIALHRKRIKALLDECYPEYALIMDGTPTFAEAECIIIQVVHRKTKKIIRLVVRLALFSESLDGATLAEHVVEVLTGAHDDPEDKGLEKRLKDMRAVSIDRASTNKRANDILKEDHGISPLSAFCFPHGTAGCGKKMEMTVGKDAIQHLAAMVKYKLCKARNVFRAAFGETAKKTGGVRWGTHLEMAAQVDRIGLSSLVANYVTVCAASGWSEKSAEKVLAAIEDLYDRHVASCEIASEVDVGTNLVSETYLNETDAPAVFTVHEGIVALRLKFAQGVEGFDRGGGFVRLEKRAHEAAAWIEENSLNPMQAEIDAALAEWTTANQQEATAKAALDTWAANNSGPAPSTQRNRRSNSRQDYATLAGRNNAATAPSNQALVDALEAAKLVVAEKARVHSAAVQKLAVFQEEHCTTFEEFKDLGVEAARPVVEEYKRLFISSSGDYSTLVAAYMAARVLNPLDAANMGLAETVEAIKGLSHFGFDEFRRGPGIIQDMIDEIPAYRAAIHSTGEAFWAQVDGAAKYDEDLRKKAEENPGQYAGRTWRDDRMEKSRRVWEWWRAKYPSLTYFFNAARLVALVPISSASVERVFSQVKFIVETVGESVLEESLETRLMERVNNYD